MAVRRLPKNTLQALCQDPQSGIQRVVKDLLVVVRDKPRNTEEDEEQEQALILKTKVIDKLNGYVHQLHPELGGVLMGFNVMAARLDREGMDREESVAVVNTRALLYIFAPKTGQLLSCEVVRAGASLTRCSSNSQFTVLACGPVERPEQLLPGLQVTVRLDHVDKMDQTYFGTIVARDGLELEQEEAEDLNTVNSDKMAAAEVPLPLSPKETKRKRDEVQEDVEPRSKKLKSDFPKISPTLPTVPASPVRSAMIGADTSSKQNESLVLASPAKKNATIPVADPEPPPTSTVQVKGLPPGFKAIEKTRKTGTKYMEYEGPDGTIYSSKKKAVDAHQAAVAKDNAVRSLSVEMEGSPPNEESAAENQEKSTPTVAQTENVEKNCETKEDKLRNSDSGSSSESESDSEPDMESGPVVKSTTVVKPQAESSSSSEEDSEEEEDPIKTQKPVENKQPMKVAEEDKAIQDDDSESGSSGDEDQDPSPEKGSLQKKSVGHKDSKDDNESSADSSSEEDSVCEKVDNDDTTKEIANDGRKDESSGSSSEDEDSVPLKEGTLSILNAEKSAVKKKDEESDSSDESDYEKRKKRCNDLNVSVENIFNKIKKSSNGHSPEHKATTSKSSAKSQTTEDNTVKTINPVKASLNLKSPKKSKTPVKGKESSKDGLHLSSKIKATKSPKILMKNLDKSTNSLKSMEVLSSTVLKSSTDSKKLQLPEGISPILSKTQAKVPKTKKQNIFEKVVSETNADRDKSVPAMTGKDLSSSPSKVQRKNEKRKKKKKDKHVAGFQ